MSVYFAIRVDDSALAVEKVDPNLPFRERLRQGTKAKREARLNAIRMLREKFPGFNKRRFRTEKAARMFLGKIKKVFPDAPVKIEGPLDDLTLVKYFCLPTKYKI